MFMLLFADMCEVLEKVLESDTEEDASDNASLFIPSDTSGSSDDDDNDDDDNDDDHSYNDNENGEAEVDDSNNNYCEYLALICCTYYTPVPILRMRLLIRSNISQLFLIVVINR